MKLFNRWELTKTSSNIVTNYKPTVADSKKITIVSEQLKGKVRQDKEVSKDVGEQHLFDLEFVEKTCLSFGPLSAAVDKFVDFVVGPGFFIKTEDEKARTIINKFLSDSNFDSLLRVWLKEGIKKGVGYLEMSGAENEEPAEFQILDAKWMFIKRNEVGVITELNQVNINKRGVNIISKKDTIAFKPHEVAILPINKIGDSVYGYGFIYSTLPIIEKILALEKDMNVLMHRKANVPIHFKVGTIENPASADDVTAIGQKLETLSEKTEFTTDGAVESKVLDFGDIGGKFQGPLKHYEDFLFFTLQIPEVLMGRGNVPEGLAQVQMEAFQRRIQSIQSEIEKVIETQIFKRILRAHAIESHVEFEWGVESTAEKNERVMKLTTLLQNPMLDSRLRTMMEKDLARVLGYNEKELETPQEEREREENTPQPIVPGQNRAEYANCNHITEDLEQNYLLREWLNFNYSEYLRAILSVLDDYNFEDLRAASQIEIKAGKFTDPQIEKLREVLDDGFTKEKTILEIADDISKKVKPKDLLKMENGMIVKRNRIPVLKLSSEVRNVMIARTETTRLASLGVIEHYKNNGVEKVQFVSSLGARTCPTCESLNGRIYEINSVPKPPIHTYCRCSIVNLTT